MYKFKGVKLNHSNPVVAAKTYHIPKKSISFTLDNNSGTTETIYFIAAHEPDIELEQLYKEIKISQNKTIGEQQYMVEQITASGFMEICDKCIKVLSFRHE
jgi:phosphopentomutase